MKLLQIWWLKRIFFPEKMGYWSNFKNPKLLFKTILIQVKHILSIISDNTTHLHKVKVMVKYPSVIEISECVQEIKYTVKREERKWKVLPRNKLIGKKKKVINITMGDSSGHSKILYSVLFIPFNVQITIFKSTSNISSLKRKWVINNANRFLLSYSTKLGC